MQSRRLFGIVLLAVVIPLFAACGGIDEEARPNKPTKTATSTITPTPTIGDTATVTPTKTPRPSGTVDCTPIANLVCGNGDTEGNPDCDEQCDDGAICDKGTNAGQACTSSSQCPDGTCKPVGGDGCAANCTQEQSRLFVFDTKVTPPSGVNVQTDEALLGKIQFTLEGQQSITGGNIRKGDVVGPDGDTIFKDGEVPLILKPMDVSIDAAVAIPNEMTPDPDDGLACVCIRAVAADEFGSLEYFDGLGREGNSGQGVVGCGNAGLEGVDYHLVWDHRLGEVGVAGFTADNCTSMGGTVETDGACQDGICVGGALDGAACGSTMCKAPHPGVCNGPRPLPVFTGTGGKGSVRIESVQSIATLVTSPNGCKVLPRDETMANRPQGADGIPCNDDDPDKGAVSRLVVTSGKAQASILHANNRPTFDISKEGTCGTDDANTPGIDESVCVTEITGAPLNCDDLENGGSGGGTVVGSTPALHSATINDNVITNRLVGQPE